MPLVRAAFLRKVKSHDVFFGTVIQYPNTHFIPLSYWKQGNTGAVKLWTDAALRINACVDFGALLHFPFWHFNTSTASMSGMEGEMHSTVHCIVLSNLDNDFLMRSVFNMLS